MVFNCPVSYDNDNFNYKYDLIMSWKKDGKTLAAKTYEYKTGKNVEKLQYSLVIKNFKDGGEYVCSWELKFKGSSISRNTTFDLPSKLLHHTRNQRDIICSLVLWDEGFLSSLKPRFYL